MAPGKPPNRVRVDVVFVVVADVVVEEIEFWFQEGAETAGDKMSLNNKF